MSDLTGHSSLSCWLYGTETCRFSYLLKLKEGICDERCQTFPYRGYTNVATHDNDIIINLYHIIIDYHIYKNVENPGNTIFS